MSPLNPREIARQLDLRTSGRGWRGTCPACGYPGTAILSGRGTLWCASCGKDGPAAALQAIQAGEAPGTVQGRAPGSSGPSDA